MTAATVTFPVSSPAQAYPPLPASAAGLTHFLNHDALLNAAGVADHSWYDQNIPFVDIPDAQIQNVYYYRWFTWREHFNYLNTTDGYTSSEFLSNVFFAQFGGAIDSAAGHVIHDGRWVRDQSYLNDYENYWMNGPGVGRTFWAASSYYDRYLVNGDAAALKSYQQGLTDEYNRWSDHYDATLGLYWTIPWEDAMEYDSASYQTSDHFGGGAGFRSSINAYQYADAMAIGKIATMNGDTATATDFTNRAKSLQANMQAKLWDTNRNFFYHQQKDNNPSGALLNDREIYGFFPWYFNMPQASDNVAWTQLTDPNGFAANYGPTSTERRSSLFMYEALNGCCRWNGPSWPYATSFVLGGLANVLDDYPAQSYVDRTTYYNQLRTFALTQYKNGVPYVAEGHDPDNNTWIYDNPTASVDYNHSSYTDLVINGLLGLRPQADNTLQIKPLVPTSWDHFALENVPYHGHNITVLYDATGSHYGQGTGLKVYVDGAQVASQAGIGNLTVNVGATIAAPVNRLVNIAVNSTQSATGTQPIASFNATGTGDSPWHPIDGRISYQPAVNTRWTSYSSTNASDWYGINFQGSASVNDVRLYFYSDGGGVQVPTSYDLQYWDGSSWATVPGQTRPQGAAQANGLNEITFPAITTSQLRVVAPNRGGGNGWGLSEFEVWSNGGGGGGAGSPWGTAGTIGDPSGVTATGIPGGQCVTVAGDDNGVNGAAVQMWQCMSNAVDQHWTHNADDSLTTLGRCLDISGNGTANGTQIQLWDCNTSGGQKWLQQADGSLKNPQSGRCLDSPGGNRANGLRLQIWDCTGGAAQKFTANGGGVIHTPGVKCVDVNGNDTGGNGAPAQIWDCQTGAVDQHWYHSSDGRLHTLSRYTLGRCLDISGNGTANGTQVQLWDCNTAAGQVWQQQADGSLKNPQSGRCLDSPNGATANGTRLQIWDCTGGGAQKFALS